MVNFAVAKLVQRSQLVGRGFLKHKICKVTFICFVNDSQIKIFHLIHVKWATRDLLEPRSPKCGPRAARDVQFTMLP